MVWIMAKQAIHREALAEFDEIQSALREERKQCLEDRRFCFVPGAQWEGPLSEQFANKPRFEVNKVQLSVIRILSEYRNNRITVDFRPVDADADDDLADTCDGLYRADEERSSAEEAYDNAMEEAVTGGFGAYRFRAEYEDEEDEEDERQRICIEPIYDADTSVFFDLGASRADKSDAKRCYVLTAMTRDAYRALYDDDPVSWSKEIQSTEFDWATPDVVYVCEHYRMEERFETVHVWRHIGGKEERFTEEDLEERREFLRAVGAKEIRGKRIRSRRVHKYILSGGGILEDCGYIAGPNIPIVPQYGKRLVIDNVERCLGHVRIQKDTQRLKNMQLSKLGEISALSSVEKPIFTREQVAGLTEYWAEDNVKNYPYGLVNPVRDATGSEQPLGPVGYMKSPAIPPAMAALLQITEEDLKDLQGNQERGEELTANISTETAHLIQNRLDMQAFIYLSNAAKARKRGGEIWLGMAREIFVEEGRMMPIVGETGERSHAVLRRPVLGDHGEISYEGDLSRAKLEVIVDVGPTSSTRRAATLRALLSYAGITQDPETQQVLGAMILLNIEGEGISEVREYFRRKLLKMGVLTPSDEERGELADELANTPPSPQDQYLQASAQAEAARGAKAQAETELAMARAQKTRVEATDIAKDIEGKDQQQALDLLDRIAADAVSTQPQ